MAADGPEGAPGEARGARPGSQMAELNDGMNDIQGEAVTTEFVGQLVPVESLRVRDDLIYSLQTLLAHYRTGSQPKGALLDRIKALRIEHEKLMQAGR